MKRNKFIIAALCAFTLCFYVSAKTDKNISSKKSIVCTTFPQYDWCHEILGDRAKDFDLTLLLDKGTDLHSFQPSFSDIAKISASDMFIYVGGESDGWVGGVLKEAKNKNLVPVNMMEVLGERVKEEEVVEGMQETEHAHDHEHDEVEYDEHVWLSVKNAAVLTNAIASQIEKLDPKNASVYAANAKNYVEKLNALDKKYSETVASSKFKTILFGDRFPFRYLADDYGLKYYAAFVGCSAESEASFETVIFLAKKVDELGLGSVLTIENSNGKIARTVIENTSKKNQKVLKMDSLQSVNQNDIKDGKSYLGTMTENLSVLKEALN